MAYNAQGEWQDEDAGVQGRVAGMLKDDSPLMKAAQADALKTGNKRGLMNSTMTARAGTRAALDVVTPIASQEAGQIAARNLSGQGFKQEGMLQGKRIESSEKIVGIQEAGADRRTGMEITSREGIAGADRTARSADLLRQITSTEGMATADRGSRESIARLGEEGADRRLTVSETGATTRAREGDAAALARTQLTETGANTRLTTSEAGANTRAAADITSREGIADAARTVDTQNAVSTAVTNSNNTYNAGYTAIMSNPNIPAEDRGTHLAHLEARHNADVTVIEALYDVDLDWPTSPATSAAPAPAAPNPTYPTMPYQEEQPNYFNE